MKTYQEAITDLQDELCRLGACFSVDEADSILQEGIDVYLTRKGVVIKSQERMDCLYLILQELRELMACP